MSFTNPFVHSVQPNAYMTNLFEQHTDLTAGGWAIAKQLNSTEMYVGNILSVFIKISGVYRPHLSMLTLMLT